MAEWLRRLTRNLIGSFRAYLNLANCVVLVREHKTSAADVQNH